MSRQLRILIADKNHSNRLKIEKSFNRFGFYCVYPAREFAEILNICQYASTPFDLLVVDLGTVTAAGVDYIEFLEQNPCIRHSLVYESEVAKNKAKATKSGCRINVPNKAALAAAIRFVLISTHDQCGFDAV